MNKVIISKKLLFIFITCLPGFLFSMEKIDFKTIDSITFQQFQNQEWKALIKTSKIGLEQGIDYYYLRMRKGIAEFELGNYIHATTDFEKALEFNQYDKAAKLYHYYALINSGKKSMAYRYSKTLSENQKEKSDIHLKIIDNIYVFGGYSITNNSQKNGSLDMLGDSAVYGEQLLLGNQKYLHIGAALNLSHFFSLYSSISYLDINKKNRFQYKLDRYYIEVTHHKPGGSYDNVFVKREEVSEKSFDDNIRQTEVYLNGKWQMSKAWSINLFANLLFVSTTQYQEQLISFKKRDTLSYNGPLNKYIFIDREMLDYEIKATDASFLDWVIGFNLQKDFKYVVLDLGSTVSKIFENHKFQSSLTGTYYPFGNLKFYGITGFTFYYEAEDNFSKDANRFIFNQTLGLQLGKHVWLEGEYIYGNIKNVNIKQGLVVYNLPDNINFMAGAKLYIFVNKHITINLLYQFYDKTGYYASYTNDFKTYTTKYQTHNIIGGIKWTF